MNKKDLNNAFLDPPESFKNIVRTTLNNLPEKGDVYYMKPRKLYKSSSFMKKSVAVIAATFILTTSAFAIGKITSLLEVTSNIPTYTTIPSNEKISSDLGFNPNLVEKFKNGYEFKGGYISKTEGLDENNEVAGTSKGVSFKYTKNKDTLMLFMKGKMLGESDKNKELLENYKNIDLYYSSYTNKLVPADYKMTAQDKLDEKSGKFVFSYGSSKIETQKQAFLNWKDGEVYYSFLATDSDLTKDELVNMAKEIIDSK
ncbi:Uncharacterised protein [[Clostridium] sordellii]|uniref:hypothetical protein n=1 Tax=Paraclostridium sordellii TaxID=1505 RepID=UPI0005DD8CE2|nr:hypothetical protein [Paeniclostridium sordellii]CEO05604.1 Uncharacterised protein [[Clostridium] sordellii] [Paeniclostridium sordellii]